MSKIKKEIKTTEYQLTREKVTTTIDNQIEGIKNWAKEHHKKFIKPEEVDAVFEKHKSFSKDVQFSNVNAHRFYLLRRQVYGQARGLRVHEDLPNKSGQLRDSQIPYNQLDEWSYNIKPILEHNKMQSFDLEETFRSSQCHTCSGNRKVACSNCNCTGRIRNMADEVVTCGDCQGSGYVKCKTCKGYGSLFDIVELKVQHVIDTYDNLITNESVASKEIEWWKRSSEVLRYDTILSLQPMGDENFIQLEQLGDDEILKDFHSKSGNHFGDKTTAKYFFDHQYYVNQYEMLSVEMDHNGSSHIVAFGLENEAVKFDVQDLEQFFQAEFSELKDEANKRRKKRNMVVSAIVASFVLAFSFYYYQDNLKTEKEKELRRQARIEKQNLEQAKASEKQKLEQAKASEKARIAKLKEKDFQKGYNNVMRLVRKKDFDMAYKSFNKLISNNLTKMNKAQEATYKALKGLNDIRPETFTQNVMSDSVFSKISKGKQLYSGEFYWVCAKLDGCENKQAPKVIRDAFLPKVKSIVKKNYRKISSVRENGSLIDNAGNKGKAISGIENQIKKYLKDNAYPTDNLKFTTSNPTLTKKNKGSWYVTSKVQVAGETLSFSTHATKYHLIGFKKEK